MLQVWEKEGEFYLTLGLYVDIDEASITETVASEGQQRQVVEPAGSSLTRGLSTRSIAEEVIQEEDLPPLVSWRKLIPAGPKLASDM